MKIYTYSLAVLLIMTSFLLYGCGEDDDNVKVMRFAETYGADHVTAEADSEFARLVEEKSDGTIKIEVYTDGELGKEDEILNKVYDGEIEFARVSLSEAGKGSDALEKCELPFVFKSKGHMWRALEQVLGPMLDLELSLKNGKIIGYMDSGAKNIYTAVPVEKPEDLENLIIRTNTFSNYSADYFSGFRVKKVTLDTDAEVTEAFEEKTIDGAEGNIIDYYNSGQYKYAPYLLKIEYRYVPDIIVMGSDTFSELTSKEQDIITSAATEACLRQRENFENEEKEAEEKLISEGCKITTPSEEFKEKLLSDAEVTFKLIPRPDVEVSLLEQIRAMK